MTLSDDIAIVTGGGSGIGRATALELAGGGADVVVPDLDEGAAAETAEMVESETAARASPLECDVSDPGAVAGLFETTIDKYGGVDVLVNNAGQFRQFDSTSDSNEDFEYLIRNNLYSAYYCTREFLQHRLDREGLGRLVNVSAMHSQYSHPNMLNYDIAKAGMEAMTRSMAVDYADSLIANTVAPGFIATPMITDTFGGNALEQDWFKDWYVKNRKIPLARAGETEEVARLIRFLASPDNSYVTGQMIPIDGGLSATY